MLFRSNGAEVLTYTYNGDDFTEDDKQIAAAVNNYGEGKVISIAYDILNRYYRTPIQLVCDLISDIMFIANDKPVAYLEEGTRMVDIIPSEKDGNLVINVINTTGIYSEQRIYSYDEIAPLYNLTICVNTDEKPDKVIAYPEKKELEFTYDNGAAHIKLEKLDIHTAIKLV